MSDDVTTRPARPDDRLLSGRWIVVTILGLGISATLFLYVYFYVRTKPFRPLTEAIAAAYPGSLPRVDGGRPKREPPVLMIALRVDFNPNENDAQFEQLIRQLIELARIHQDLTQYERLEIRLVQVRPERSSPTRYYSCAIADLPRTAGQPLPPSDQSGGSS